MNIHEFSTEKPFYAFSYPFYAEKPFYALRGFRGLVGSIRVPASNPGQRISAKLV